MGCPPTCGLAAETNRTIYLTYTVLPEGTDAAAPLRSPGVLLVARAKLSSDDRRLEDLEVLLNAGSSGSCRRSERDQGLTLAAEGLEKGPHRHDWVTVNP